MASFIAKLDMNKLIYITLRTTIFTAVLLGIIIVLNDSFGAETIINISKSLNGLDIGYPRSWTLKTITFKSEIIGCYYLVLFGVIAMTLIASAHEHKGIKRYRDNGKERNIFFIVTGVLVIWGFFYMRPPTGTGGITNKVLNQVYNSEFLLLGWSIVFLLVAICYGKSLRVIFNK